ncbi:dephospho-CoA kinase [Lentisalinibacter orientalis]|uniref:dephospho-CoA kinase n=1 Tax=Lentisalinibacter orientalis TaxID=2992241 RepID=UPI00386B8F42
MTRHPSADDILRIGLTGGIASGKTAVSDMFAKLGAPVIDTDRIAREVVQPGRPALAEIVEEFGEDVLNADGSLDRRALRERVFTEDGARQRLEAITHPRIRDETLRRMHNAGGPYQVIVVPLLVESGFGALVDRVLVVDCPPEVQRQRLMERDGESAGTAEAMMRSQTDRETRLDAADDVVDNAGSLEDTRRQVEHLHNRYLALARVAREDED